MKTGQILQLFIHDVSRGGAGVARLENGLTVFVPCTMTGDTVRARITELKKKFASAELIEIIQPAIERQQPLCPVFGQCGGCQWQHIPYAMQWQIKLSGIRQPLSSAKIAFKKSVDEYPAQQVWHYRNRVQLRGYRDSLGYYAPRSHDIVDIHQCAIANEQINAALATIKEQGRQIARPYKVELEVMPDGKVRTIWNEAHAAAGFRQVNDEQNHHLRQWISQALEIQQPVLDLYGGSANLSWNLACQGREVMCVDLSAPLQAPEDCPSSITFYQSDILPWLKQRITDIKFKRLAEPATPSSAILDPPRGGLGDEFTEIVERLELLKVNEIVAVGCKTDSWVRDLEGFLRRGWSIHRVAAFDFFPHTVHVETAALLKLTVR